MPPNLYRTTLLLVLSIVIESFAGTKLSGELSQDTLYVKGSPYTVEKDLIIPKEKTVVIEAGCIFLFKQFTGFLVNGTLKVNGTNYERVVFTSINDQHYNGKDSTGSDSTEPAKPFDWNGIDVLPTSMETSINHASLRYIVNGINSRTPLISINSCYFTATGQYDVIIDGKIYSVTQGTPFSYTAPQLQSNSQSLVPEKKRFQLKKIKPQLRYTGLAVGAIGLIGGTVLTIMSAHDRKEIAKMKPGDINPNTGNVYTKEEVNGANDERSIKIAGSVIGFSLGGIGAIGFGLTFLIK